MPNEIQLVFVDYGKDCDRVEHGVLYRKKNILSDEKLDINLIIYP